MVAVSALMIYHSALPFSSFFTYRDRPYPPLPAGMRALLETKTDRTASRLIGIGQFRNERAGYVYNLMYNFPSVYNLLSVNGYDPLIEDLPETRFMTAQLEKNFQVAAKRYGIRWVITARAAHPVNGDPSEIASTRKMDFEKLVRHTHYAKPVLTLPEYHVWELAAPDPLAFPDHHPSQPLPITFNSQGLSIDLAKQPPC